MKYNFEQSTFLVEKYLEKKNVISVKRAWNTKYLGKNAPSSRNILFTVKRFKETGSVLSRSKKSSNRADFRKNSKIAIEKLISEDPRLSIRALSVLSETSASTTRSILKDDLAMKPYKIQELHKLQLLDHAKRLKFAEWFLKLPVGSENSIIMTDESYFYLTKPLNKQNNRIWSKEVPSEGIERPLYDAKILVFCAISAKKIYGPFFFSTSVNQYNYLEMLKDWFWPKHQRTARYKKYYFQQDGAPAHTAKVTQEWLKSKFGAKFIDKQMWPPRSPDLNPCDYFLWGYLKSKVYYPLPKTIEDLQVNIEREIKNINENI
jgi:hypothetical protein